MKDYIDHTFHYLQGGNHTAGALYDDYRDQWNTRPLARIPGEYPVHVDVETTTACNLKCRMCFQSFDPPKRQFMGEALVHRIIDEIGGHSYSMKFQYRGEPLIDPNLSEYIYHAKRVGIVETMINTNANLLDAETAEELVNSGLDKVICSVEGSNRDVYNETRIGGDWDKVVMNIKNLIKTRNSYGYDTPRVRVQMVKTESNTVDVSKFLKFWKKLADEVAYEDELDYHAEERDNTPLPNWACPQLYQRLIVLADGDIVPCCRSIAGGKTKQIVLGNISDISIAEAWNGDKMRDLRAQHELGKSHKVDMCARCGLRKDMVKKVGA